MTESVDVPSPNFKEILRYAGCKHPDERITALLDRCVEKAKNCFSFRVCYGVFDLSISENLCDFGAFKAQSDSLSKNLDGCDRVVIFGATVGIEIDRFIMKYSRISPSEAIMYQAFGAERIEALCDAFCQRLEGEFGKKLKPRFSPGYGDLSLAVQKDIFSVLGCEKRIGLSLNDSMLMSPTKSVTAIVGITR